MRKGRSLVPTLGIAEPCALDDTRTLSESFGLTAFPTYFLFGADKRLKCHAVGSFGVKMMQAALARLYDAPEPAAP